MGLSTAKREDKSPAHKCVRRRAREKLISACKHASFSRAFAFFFLITCVSACLHLEVIHDGSVSGLERTDSNFHQQLGATGFSGLPNFEMNTEQCTAFSGSCGQLLP
jgi:hypothetical protein